MLECRNKRQMLEGQQQTIFNYLVGIFQKFATTNPATFVRTAQKNCVLKMH